MSTGQLLRLSQKTQHLGSTPGGGQQLSNADVAAALGTVKPELSRLLLAAIWCPGLFDARRATDIINGALLHQYEDQQRELLIAKLEYVVATDGSELQPIVENDSKVKRLQEQAWPQPGHGKYPRLIQVAIAEFMQPRACPSCGGNRRIMNDRNKWVICKNCNGTGENHTPHTDAWRARAYGGIHRSSWRTWAGLYSHIQDIINASYRAGRQQIRHILSDEDNQP